MSWITIWTERFRRLFGAYDDVEDEVETSDPEIAALLSRARSLPRSVEPERDLWSGIENRISGGVGPVEGGAHASEPSPWSLTALFPRPLVASAMAVALVATTAVTVLWVVQPPAGTIIVADNTGDTGNTDNTDAADTNAVDASTTTLATADPAAIAARLRERDGVADVHQSILALLEAHRADLPPETIAVLDENLRSIDRAIAEIHLAFEMNPDHHALGFLLAEAYRSEADLLERLEGWLEKTPEVTS